MCKVTLTYHSSAHNIFVRFVKKHLRFFLGGERKHLDVRNPVARENPKSVTVGKNCVHFLIGQIAVSAEIHNLIVKALAVGIVACYARFSAVPFNRIVALGRAGVVALCRGEGVGKIGQIGSLADRIEKCGRNSRIASVKKSCFTG